MQGVRYNSTGGSAAIVESGHNRLLCGPGPLDIPLDKWVKGDITMNAPLVRAITKCPLCGGYKCRGRLVLIERGWKQFIHSQKIQPKKSKIHRGNSEVRR